MKEHQEIDHTKLQPNLHLLYKEVGRWFRGSLNRGLLQLTVPHRQSLNDGRQQYWVRYTDEYLNVTAAFCPSLEYFDGGQVTNTNYHYNTSGEMLFCSLEA